MYLFLAHASYPGGRRQLRQRAEEEDRTRRASADHRPPRCHVRNAWLRSRFGVRDVSGALVQVTWKVLHSTWRALAFANGPHCDRWWLGKSPMLRAT